MTNAASNQQLEPSVQSCEWCKQAPETSKRPNQPVESVRCTNRACPVSRAGWMAIGVWNGGRGRFYFCSCGGALTAEEYLNHYFELGHDRGDPAFTTISRVSTVGEGEATPVYEQGFETGTAFAIATIEANKGHVRHVFDGIECCKWCALVWPANGWQKWCKGPHDLSLRATSPDVQAGPTVDVDAEIAHASALSNRGRFEEAFSVLVHALRAASPAIPQLGGERAITLDWDKHNARRHELIEAKRSRALEDNEAAELVELQWLAGMKRALGEGPPPALPEGDPKN